MHKLPSISELRQALHSSTGSTTPEQRFQDMVATGIVNSKGEVTKLIGGDAEPEPGAERPASSTFGSTCFTSGITE